MDSIYGTPPKMGAEVEIPAYEAMNEGEGVGCRMLEILAEPSLPANCWGWRVKTRRVMRRPHITPPRSCTCPNLARVCVTRV